MRKCIVWLSCLFVNVLFIASCVIVPPYAPVSGRRVAAADNFAVDLPPGWRQHNLSADPLNNFITMLEKRRKLSWDRLRLTRDGLLLQQICIGRIPIADEMPNTKRKLAQEMTPLEAAELISDDLRSNANLTRQEIVGNVPATIGGYSGFKLHYTYTTDDLKVEGLFYGAIVGPWLYYILYEAPAQYYFNKDLQLFERTTASFVILPGSEPH
ncbi:MAG TPA: hypothetical protein VFK65_17970 [Candidatus Binatia bacterium]|nr:hypothetical protein [Candidatus Binatia bacterium]